MNLLETIKRSKNARRIFGKRELVIIEKQLSGVRLTASEKTRLSRDIRKKFEAIDELSPFASDFKLKKGIEVKRIVDETKEIILDTHLFSKIKRLLLFGSASRNELTFRSDIDIAVEFTKIDEREAFNFRKEVLGRTNSRVDVQVYNVLPEKIKKEIEKDGRTIYENKSL